MKIKKIFTKEHVVNVTLGVLIVGTVLFWFGSLFVDDSYQSYNSHSYTADTFDTEELMFDPSFQNISDRHPATPAPQQVPPAKRDTKNK